jgi:hypothetical protein
MGAIDPVRGSAVSAGGGRGPARYREGGLVVPFARRDPGSEAAPVKVWLHPRLSDLQAQQLADRMGCRMTWKGRGVALVPLGHA